MAGQLDPSKPFAVEGQGAEKGSEVGLEPTIEASSYSMSEKVSAGSGL
ncbi:MAG: hypothetical protein BWX48_03701 [Verrucomicrobia bacterium ADurb.Bin006]|jgi:hypothetical protein|nr:MAG: hypothetical protein BWX48_03701 [Verrucomicrobia bacterium ADurb.Bin006]